MRNFSGSPLSGSLARRLWATLTPREPDKKPRPQTIVHGPKVRSVNARPNTKQADAVLLEIRRLREFEKMFPAQIVARLNELGIPLTKNRVIQIISYQTRAHLVPERRLRPYLPEQSAQG